MKNANYYLARGEKPKIGEEFMVNGIRVVTVPDALVHCNSCVRHTHFQHDPEACHALPTCGDISFVPKATYDSDEFKVQMVKWRMGVLDDDDET